MALPYIICYSALYFLVSRTIVIHSPLTCQLAVRFALIRRNEVVRVAITTMIQEGLALLLFSIVEEAIGGTNATGTAVVRAERASEG